MIWFLGNQIGALWQLPHSEAKNNELNVMFAVFVKFDNTYRLQDDEPKR